MFNDAEIRESRECAAISAAQYHAGMPAEPPALSRSIAQVLLTQTPYRAWEAHPRLNPNYQPEESEKFDVGTAAHALLLEGADRMAVLDFDDWRTKAAREARDESRLAGKIPVLAKQSAAIYAMVDQAHAAIADCPDLAGKTLKDGTPEKSYFWQMSGAHLKARLDWASNDNKLIIDYKTTELSSPDAWMRQIGSSGYDLQDVFYREAVYKQTGIMPEFIFCVQETKAPYLVYFVTLPEAWLDIGRRKFERALTMWNECLTRNEWPAYDQRAYVPEVPNWEITKAENDEGVFANWSKEAFLFGRVPNVD